MNATNSIIEKQLLIHKLLDNERCLDIRNEIKSYLFIDKFYLKARKQKNKLIENFNIALIYSTNEEESQWNLRYGYEIIFSCQHCNTCGGYVFGGFTLFSNPLTYIASRAVCCCDGFNISNLTHVSQQPLQIFDGDDDDDDEHDDDVVDDFNYDVFNDTFDY